MGTGDQPNPWRFAHMGLEFAGAAVVLALVGWWIDSQLGTAPFGALIGLGLGVTGGTYLFIKEGLRANREAGQAARDKDSNQEP